MKIKFYQPYYDKRESESINKVIKSGWVTTGQVSKEFEERFANYIGSKYCVLVNSCTSALFLSLKYFETEPLDIVYAPSLTYVATINEIHNAGYSLEWGDVDEKGLLKLSDKIIDIAIPVHFAGNKAPLNYKNLIIEDSAHRIQPKDFSGNTMCFSFYATKNLSMGEGGAICTDDEKMYEWLLKARSHGINKDGYSRYNGDWEYDVMFRGWKANLSDIHAAIGLAQLDKMEEMESKRELIIKKYNEELNLDNTGTHLYPIKVKNRNEFMLHIANEGIQLSVHFKPVHLMTAYKDYYEKLPMTEKIGKEIVSLPLYPGLKQQEIEYIIKKVKKYDR